MPKKPKSKRPGVFAINEIARSNRRRAQREAIVGKKGVRKQRARAVRADIKARITGGSRAKASTIQTIKRVGEYKRAKKKKMVNNREQ
jgi:hypothetical protein